MVLLSRRAVRAALAVGVLIAVLTPLAFWLRDSSIVQVEHVTVSGIGGEQSRPIVSALRRAGETMTTLHMRAAVLRAAVASYPVVRSVHADTDFPHGLRVVVDAYRAVAALHPVRGGATAVAGDGTLLPGNATNGLPVVGVRLAPSGTRLPAGETLSAVQVIAAAPQALRTRVARVYDGPHGLAATMQRGPKLYFGGAESLVAKWGAAAAVLSSSTSRGAAYVDLRVPGRPVAGGLQARPAESQAPL
ncbi:MAG TPA: cell division protein FtsQ/DivIB [Solirubrobacteraceae bacterium]|jgi:cell division protein FtsQ|nr:cell division protein FtsQ/DivIB [Solirubrobacteraceae bacterium]